MKKVMVFALVFGLLAAAGCKDKGPEIKTVKAWSVNGLDGVVVKHGVEIDSKISKDGKGSLKITTPGATTVSLYTAGPLDIDEAKLVYQAMVKAQDVQGDVYLEMWCVFKDKGEFFSRGLEAPLKGTADWTLLQTPFALEDDQKPEIVRLNIVITGPGVVWIDDVKLLSVPL